MTTAERNSTVLQIVLVALSPLATAALAASFLWGVDAMAAGAPLHLVGLPATHCPGCAACGLSRAFSAVSHGELARAVGFNAGVLVLYPAFWALAIAGPLIAARLVLNRSSTCRPHPSR